MPFVSLTRLRLRSVIYLPGFALYATRSTRQVRRAPGFQSGGLLPDRHWTFWTITMWNTAESMRAYMLSGAHKQAMPKLLDWCDEASAAHWEQPGADLPSWSEADQQMRTTGRASKVRHPSPRHADLSYAAPRVSGGTRIYPDARSA